MTDPTGSTTKTQTSWPASPDSLRGLFVTGTGTGVGKSIVSASIVARLNAEGLRTAAFKPVVTGLDEPDAVWPLDHELLSSATGWQPVGTVTPYTFGPAVSPHLAAKLAGETIELAKLEQAFAAAAASAEAIICEGVGGALVPLSLDPPLSVLKLMTQFALPVVVATHPGLGTISDTRLTVDRLHAEGLQVAGIVLSGWPAEPTTMQQSNRESLASLLEIEVHTIPITTPDSLAQAADNLPLIAWLHAPDHNA